MVGGGVANVECARALSACKANDIDLSVVSSFSQQLMLPKVHGNVAANLLSMKRLGKKWNTLQSFASSMLSIVPILAIFLCDVVGDDTPHPLRDHMQCAWRLRMIIGILQLGPSNAMNHAERLKQLIRERAELFVKLYPGRQKPKFRDSFHVVDNMLFLGKLLSCFVAGRKHWIRCALFVFRCIDNVVVKSMLSRQREQIRSESESIFSRIYMVRSKAYNFAGTLWHRASGASLPCGSVVAGDFVWLSTNVVALVIAFWRQNCAKHIEVQVETYSRLDDRATRWQAESTTIFVDSSCVVSALIYSGTGRNTVFVIPAAASYL